MNTRELEITIAPDGTVELHVAGFKGKKCLEISKLIEDIVGTKASEEFTGEFYEPEEEVHLQGEQHREATGGPPR